MEFLYLILCHYLKLLKHTQTYFSLFCYGFSIKNIFFSLTMNSVYLYSLVSLLTSCVRIKLSFWSKAFCTCAYKIIISLLQKIMLQFAKFMLLFCLSIFCCRFVIFSLRISRSDLFLCEVTSSSS